MSYEILVDNSRLSAPALKLLQTASIMVGQRRPTLTDLLTTHYSVMLWLWRLWI